jgi:hypothetical protein
VVMDKHTYSKSGQEERYFLGTSLFSLDHWLFLHNCSLLQDCRSLKHHALLSFCQ